MRGREAEPEPLSRMTIHVYRLGPTGDRTPVRTVTVSGDGAFTALDNPGAYPPCRCPLHRDGPENAGRAGNAGNSTAPRPEG